MNSILHLPNGGKVNIGHYKYSLANPLRSLRSDGLIIEGLWGFNDLGGYFGREIIELLGVGEDVIRKTCSEKIEKCQQITVVALRSLNAVGTLKSVAFLPTEAFRCCENIRDKKYGLPNKDFYYSVTYEALELLAGHGCSSVAIANLTGYNYYHKNIGNCVAEAIAHFALDNRTLQSIFSIGGGPDLTYGVTYFNENPELIGRHRSVVREVHFGKYCSFTNISLPHP